ncbi:hypothetical protein ACSNOK_20470 [Streptomyces sp. URMC 126]
MWQRAQTCPGGGWTGWGRLDGGLVSVASETNTDGRVELFGVDRTAGV